MKKIYTSKREEILVDDADYEWLNSFRWHLKKSREKYYPTRGIYDPVTQNTKSMKMSRMIMDAPKGILVDHRNGDTMDHTRGNLRLATNSENGFNSRIPTHNTSGYKWICWDKSRSKWHVSTKLNQKKINVGRFDTLEEAIQAVQDKILPLMGEFVPSEYSRI